MRIFLDQLVMHAQNIVEWHPGPKQLRHDTMFLFGIFVDIVEGLARQSGQQRKSATATRTSALGGKAEVDFGRLNVCF